MGDHGLRHGGIRATKQGELEDHNPAMVLVVPEHLRNNHNLMTNLNANSKQLVTHYDTYATLVNIARVSAEGTNTLVVTLVMEGSRTFTANDA